MSLGTGVFLSTALISLVALYLGTRDRWPWLRIVLVVAVLGILTPLGLVLRAWWVDAATVRADRQEQQRYREAHRVRIGDPVSVVLQRQGVPTRRVSSTDSLAPLVHYYEDASPLTTDLIFWFAPDSSLLAWQARNGLRDGGFGFPWVPSDSIVIGLGQEEVYARLPGEVCGRWVGPDVTRLDIWDANYDTRLAPDHGPGPKPEGAVRYVYLGHGHGRVVRHGVRRGPCSSTPR